MKCENYNSLILLLIVLTPTGAYILVIIQITAPHMPTISFVSLLISDDARQLKPNNKIQIISPLFRLYELRTLPHK